MNKSILVGAGVVVGLVGVSFLAKRAMKTEVVAPVAASVVEQAPVAKAAPATVHAFMKVHNNVRKEVAYDPSWANGTGYFDGAIAVPLKKGEVARSLSDDGRRIILIGTENGTAVFFERYTPGDSPLVIVSNLPQEVRSLIPNGSLSSDVFAKAVNDLTC